MRPQCGDTPKIVMISQFRVSHAPERGKTKSENANKSVYDLLLCRLKVVGRRIGMRMPVFATFMYFAKDAWGGSWTFLGRRIDLLWLCFGPFESFGALLGCVLC